MKRTRMIAAALALAGGLLSAPRSARSARPAARRSATQPPTRSDNQSKQETKRTAADLSRLLPMRVGLKWHYDGMTIAKGKHHPFRWTVQCVQVARADGVQAGLFIHDYHKVKRPPSIEPERWQQPTGPGRFALVLLPGQAWFIRLTDVKPSAEATVAAKDLLAIADKLRKAVAEDKVPRGLAIMGLLSLGKPRPAGADYPAQSVSVSGTFFGGYAPWEAVPVDDPRLKDMTRKLEGKLTAWIKQVGGASFPARAVLQPGVGLIGLRWITPFRTRDRGYWIQLKRPADAGERAELLKQHVDTFGLTLKHLNPHGPNIRPVVRLTVAKMGGRARTWRISKAQAVKLIDHLAAEGFLASSGNIFDTKAADITGPCCVLSVGGPPNVSFEENMGWDLRMLERLDALRKALDKGSDAGKAMDKVIKALEPQRKKWQKAPTTQPGKTAPDANVRRVCMAALRKMQKNFVALAAKYPKELGHLGPGAIDEKKLLLRFPVKNLPKTAPAMQPAAGRSRLLPLQPRDCGLFLRFTVPMPIVNFPTPRPMTQWLYSKVGFSWWWMWPNRSFPWKAHQDLMKMVSQALVPLNDLENATVAADLAKRPKGSYALRGRPGVKLTIRLSPRRDVGGTFVDLYATNETKGVLALFPPFMQIIGDGKPWHYRAHGSLSMLTHAFGSDRDPFIYIKPGQTAKVGAAVVAGLSAGRHTVRVAAGHPYDYWVDMRPTFHDGAPITRKVPGAWTGVLVSGEMTIDIPTPAAANKKAAERAKLLKKTGTVYLVLQYHVGWTGAKPSLHPAALHLATSSYKIELIGGILASLTPKEAANIIDHLAREGFLGQAENVVGKDIAPPQGPAYTLTLFGAGRTKLYQVLGWDLKMLRRLEALRNVLAKDSAAGKAMDKLLAALEPQRKKWQKAAAAAGQPAVK